MIRKTQRRLLLTPLPPSSPSSSALYSTSPSSSIYSTTSSQKACFLYLLPFGILRKRTPNSSPFFHLPLSTSLFPPLTNRTQRKQSATGPAPTPSDTSPARSPTTSYFSNTLPPSRRSATPHVRAAPLLHLPAHTPHLRYYSCPRRSSRPSSLLST